MAGEDRRRYPFDKHGGVARVRRDAAPRRHNHAGRMHVESLPIRSDEDFEDQVRRIDQSLEAAVDRVITCRPDHLILGISSLAFWGGDQKWADELVERIRGRAGEPIGVAHAADAVPAALRAYGVKGPIAIIEPYFPTIEPRLRSFLGELGDEVPRITSLKDANPVGYGQVTALQMVRWIRELDGPDIKALVQFGTNLPMARLAVEAERWLGKPVSAINVATYWHALRQQGINDQMQGFGRLLSEF